MSTEEAKSGEQKAAESDVDRFRKRLGPFVVAAETTRMPMVFTNAREHGEPIIFANDSFLSLVGYRREQVLGENFRSLMTRGADAEAQAKIEVAFGRESEDDPEICFRRQDGSQFWASIFISPVRDEGGEVVQHFVSLVNLTKHRQEQDRLRFLLEELNHRTQNTLATVLAIAGQTLRGMADAKAIKALESRILALSRTHSLLGTENWDSVGLRDMLDQVLEPFSSTDGRGARFLMEGDNISLQAKAALTLTLVFHELATNAVEHGALANDAGQIAISWQMETGAPPRMRLRWRERGGPAVIPPTRKGFGSRLVENGLAHDNAEAHLAYESGGVVCEIVMPVGAVRTDER